MKIILNIPDGHTAKVLTSNSPISYHQLNDGDSINRGPGVCQTIIITEPVKPMSASSESGASGSLSFA